MDNYICIHGHFYQPPRENPWLEAIELQDSAYPYHDWNSRITEECYKPNGASRILGGDKKIVNIINNYTQISFDFGPTLMSWLEDESPDVYKSILDADKESIERFGGHGSAIAQAYNHMILPLANSRDKETQVIWGIEDFKKRFGREPEGMWLAETAVDIESLEIMAKHGIKFTILAPSQAARIRGVGEKDFRDVSVDSLDAKRCYRCNLSDGLSIGIFFYTHDISNDVAYGHLLHNGAKFAEKLVGKFDHNNNSGQLVHIATDGETYGHHHRQGDMALSFCLHHIKSNNLAKVTNYGEFLEKFGAETEVEIKENTSWSCAHGVERWRSNCGCVGNWHNSGKQQWRGPLRKALNFVRDKAVNIYEEKMGDFAKDAWQVRNDYISVINDRSSANVEGFISKWNGRNISEEEKITFLKLCELQRNAQLMFTSCGWFFDFINGIETVQLMLYASRTIQLIKEVGSEDFEEEFSQMLAEAPAHDPLYANGREVYENLAKTTSIDLNRVASHFAISSLFEQKPEDTDIYCYRVKLERYEPMEAGIQRLALGRATIKSRIILETDSIDFAALHFGDHNLICSVSGRMEDKKFERVLKDMRSSFKGGDITQVIRLMNITFEPISYSLWSLFRDEQRRILDELLSATRSEIDASFRRIYEYNYTIIQMMRSLKVPLPKPLAAVAEFNLNSDLAEEIEKYELDITKLSSLTEEVTRMSLQIDKPGIGYIASKKINEQMLRFQQYPLDIKLIETTDSSIRILRSIVSELDLNEAQNNFFHISKKLYPKMVKKSSTDKNAKLWVSCFENLGTALGIAVK
jgi:alpha-amylase/alpha-mannosidase (GH57 family)